MSEPTETRFGFLRPDLMFLIFWGMGVLVPLIPFLEEEDGFSLLWGYPFGDKVSAVSSALLMYVLALFGVMVGVRIASLWPRAGSGVRRIVGSGIADAQFRKRSIVVAAIGFGAVIATVVLLGGVGAWVQAGSDRIRQFAGLNSVVLLQNSLLCVSIAWFIRRNPALGSRPDPLSPKLIAYSLVALGLVAFQGAKSTVFVYLLSMLVVWHVRVRTIRVSRLALAGVLMFVGLMAYHVVKQEYLVVGEFVFFDAKEGWLKSIGRMLFVQLTGNLMQLQCMSVLMEAMPRDLPFLNGETLKMVFLIWVPSSIYPDKPLTAPGVFTMAFWPEKWEDEATTMPPGLFGELYMNFGTAGVLFGSLCFGGLYGWSHWRARRSGSDSALGLYALMLGVMLHYFRGELASVTVLLCSMAAPLWWMLRAPRVKSLVS